ncbi:paREP7 [Pyrobaculum oguniense TE7]|uniref:PaREP7 n=1 Tax=Pyrobaculum oguniense (strain DSM 13380 / JCM 10595 / TE7) TaxID=698757 RepID=H6Q7U3_PYROT|nr:paREP7 [Pyrobaculum oguniense TE7]
MGGGGDSRRWEEQKRLEASSRGRSLEDYESRWDEASRRFAQIEEVQRASAEALSRYVWDDLKEEIKIRGEAVLRRTRNANVDNVDRSLG